ncbi:MAG: 1-deoxy-D-xylulose-5-phosphate reductoisomerase [Planctomycetaceae bacterium]|nr:1-deoxy-D-xylulose-5-phosphate reductoisomerase [Planctomycetaceae bacterium]
MNRVVVLGSSGSIGTSCLAVVAAHADRLQAVGLSVHRRWETLADQVRQHRPRWAVVADETTASAAKSAGLPRETEWLFGEAGVEQIAGHADVDTVVCAIVGAAGLRGAFAALETGKRVALANKETLVVAGPLVPQLAARTGAKLIPVDSEHSAVFQCLEAGRRSDLKRIVLTASGGPFRGRTAAQLRDVTVEQALAHPTWKMGPKITIDSATMMNKALEIIEARWLFGLDAGQIDVVVHPQSVVHSMVEFVDGSTVAQLSPPDMRLPIQYALTYPERWPGVCPTMDWTKAAALTFEPPDFEAFPALQLGFEVARRGGTCGAVLNAANEVAVDRFLKGELRFPEITSACRDVLQHHHYDSSPTLTDLLTLDRWARQETLRWKSSQ